MRFNTADRNLRVGDKEEDTSKRCNKFKKKKEKRHEKEVEIGEKGRDCTKNKQKNNQGSKKTKR